MPLLQLSTDHINVIKPSNRSPNLYFIEPAVTKGSINTIYPRIAMES